MVNTVSKFAIQGNAQAAISNDPQVAEKLGVALEFGELRNLEFTAENRIIKFDVTGSKSTATASVETILNHEIHEITKIELRCLDGTVLNVDPKLANAAANDPTNITLPEFEMPEEGKPEIK